MAGICGLASLLGALIASSDALEVYRDAAFLGLGQPGAPHEGAAMSSYPAFEADDVRDSSQPDVDGDAAFPDLSQPGAPSEGAAMSSYPAFEADPLLPEADDVPDSGQPDVQPERTMMPPFPAHEADRVEPAADEADRVEPVADGARQQRAQYAVPSFPSYEPDLTELILLAGSADNDIKLADEAAVRIGWGQEAISMSVSSTKMCFEDHVVAFKKDSHCVAAFGAQDDKEDDYEMSAGVVEGDVAEPNTTEICGFRAHVGVAAQLGSLMRGSNWTRFLAFFEQAECEMVTAVGHSMGGTLASLFAACANAGNEGFGARSDFGLVTMGAFPATLEPLYSGTPGTPFRGTRYAVTGLDGGADPWGSVPAGSKALRTDLVQFFVEAATTMEKLSAESGSTRAPGYGKAAADFLMLLDSFLLLPQEEVEPYWQSHRVWDQLMASGIDLKLIYLGYPDDPAQLELQPMLTFLMKKLAMRGDLFIYYDPIASWLSPLGYVHPLVDFQPIAHEQIEPREELARVAASEATYLPRVDRILTIMSRMVNFQPPNHGNCCYYSGSHCVFQYTGLASVNKACLSPLLR